MRIQERNNSHTKKGEDWIKMSEHQLSVISMCSIEVPTHEMKWWEHDLILVGSYDRIPRLTECVL